METVTPVGANAVLSHVDFEFEITLLGEKDSQTPNERLGLKAQQALTVPLISMYLTCNLDWPV